MKVIEAIDEMKLDLGKLSLAFGEQEGNLLLEALT